VKEDVTPEWIRSLIPYSVFKADKENYAAIADAMEKLLKEIDHLRSTNIKI
jgi:hypothetical protein